MFELFRGLVDEVSCESLSISLAQDPICRDCLLVLAKELSLKNVDAFDFLVEELILTLTDIHDSSGAVPDLKDCRVVLERLRVTVSLSLLDRLLQKHMGDLEKQGVRSLKVGSEEGVLSISGVYHKLIDFAFSLLLRFSIDQGLIRIDFQLRFIDGLNLPGFLKTLIMGILKNRMTLTAIKIEEDHILIDPVRLCPMPLSVKLSGIGVKGGYLSIEAID
jgi:hypothetical protein